MGLAAIRRGTGSAILLRRGAGTDDAGKAPASKAGAGSAPHLRIEPQGLVVKFILKPLRTEQRFCVTDHASGVKGRKREPTILCVGACRLLAFGGAPGRIPLRHAAADCVERLLSARRRGGESGW